MIRLCLVLMMWMEIGLGARLKARIQATNCAFSLSNICRNAIDEPQTAILKLPLPVREPQIARVNVSLFKECLLQ